MSEKNQDLKRVRAIRSGNRAVVTKYTKEAIELLKQGDTTNKDRLSTVANLLNDKIRRLKELDAQILGLCEIDDIEREIEETEEMFSRVSDVTREINKFTSGIDKINSESVTMVQKISGQNTNSNMSEEMNANSDEQQQQQQQPAQVEAPTSELSTETPHVNVNAQLVNHATSIKLPKLVLPKFRGDITSYRTFWESFESAVHKNVYLSNIDKFNSISSLVTSLGSHNEICARRSSQQFCTCNRARTVETLVIQAENTYYLDLNRINDRENESLRCK